MAKTLASQAKDGGSIPLARSVSGNRRPPAVVEAVEMLRRVLITAVCCGLATPASALASAGPVPPVQGGSGVTMPNVDFAYVAVRDGADTRIDRMRKKDWKSAGTKLVRGRVGIPGVGMDNSTTGLSADGRTLVVAGNPHRSGTRIVVLDAHRLRS